MSEELKPYSMERVETMAVIEFIDFCIEKDETTKIPLEWLFKEHMKQKHKAPQASEVEG